MVYKRERGWNSGRSLPVLHVIFVYMQKLRNSSAVYHKTRKPFGAKICMDITFQLLLYIVRILVTSYENPQLVNSLDIRYVPSRTNYSYADQ